jgi:Immunity protein family (Imm11)
MKCYTFQPACDTKETGSQYPQVQKMKPGYNYKASNSVHALSRAHERFPDYRPDFDYFILHSWAKMTDLLSVAVISGGFLISERLKYIFEQFIVAPHKFYRVRLKYKNTFYDNYYWMHIICNLTDFVDYQQSTFFIYYNYSHNLGNISVKSKEEYLKKLDNLKIDNPDKNITIWADKIKLTDGFDTSLDLFMIGTFNADYYISESLRSAIINAKLTGCNIVQAENIFT